MARLVIFDKLPVGNHTYFDHVETGAQVPVQPGDAFPARLMENPEHYVEMGVARIEGKEDGGDGRIERLAGFMRGSFAIVAPLPGRPSTWTLEAMLAKAKEMNDADLAAKEAFAAEEVPETIEEIHAADASTPA